MDCGTASNVGITWLSASVIHMANELDAKVKKIIQSHVDAYPGRWKKAGEAGVCAYVVLDRNTGAQVGRDRSAGGDVCHEGMLYSNDAIVVNAHKPEWFKKHPDFCRWVLKESPFSHGILNRTDDKELFNQAAVLDLDLIGCAGALWICKAMRHFTEDTWKVSIWNKLREQGLNGLQAFIGSDILQADGSPGGYTHVSLFNYASPAGLRAIYDKIRVEKKRDGTGANTPAPNKGVFDYRPGQNWGSLKGKKEKLPDGWGGYTEVARPCSAEEYASQLREIFEGDPKNVR